MNRRGVALLAVLWVLTALTALTGVGMIAARLGSETTRNRILLARAEWAREACAEILLSRFAVDSSIGRLDSIDLGRDTWCRAVVDNPAARLNLQAADRNALVSLLASLHVDSQIADSMLALRKRGPVYDLRQVPGVDSALAGRLEPYLTTRGTGTVNVNLAPANVLRVLPGMTEEGVYVLLVRRGARPLHSADEFAGALSQSAQAVFLPSYAEFVRATVFQPSQVVVTIEGGVRGTPIRTSATLTAVPLPGRLAVIRRETE